MPGRINPADSCFAWADRGAIDGHLKLGACDRLRAGRAARRGGAVDEVRACVDRALSPERLRVVAERAMAERVTNAPMRAPEASSAPYEAFRMAVETAKEWPPGRTLRARFVDGDEVVRSRVAEHAR